MIILYVLYVFDMFLILLSGDSLRDLWNVCMYDSFPPPITLLADPFITSTLTLVVKLNLFFSNLSHIPFSFTFFSTMKSISLAILYSIFGPGCSSAAPDISITAIVSSKNHVCVVPTIFISEVSPTTCSVFCQRGQHYVYCHFALLPTCLLSTTSELLLRS